MTLSQEEKVRRALIKAAKTLNVKVDLTVPLETDEEQMLQAQAVLNYFEVGGRGFEHIECRTCNLMFAYSWRCKGVKHCSVQCMAIAMEKIGLTWDRTRPPERRWGRNAPAIVPPQALELLNNILDPQEV